PGELDVKVVGVRVHAGVLVPAGVLVAAGEDFPVEDDALDAQFLGVQAQLLGEFLKYFDLVVPLQAEVEGSAFTMQAGGAGGSAHWPAVVDAGVPTAELLVLGQEPGHGPLRAGGRALG